MGILKTPAVIRKYYFSDDVILDVAYSLTIKDGKYYSINAVCADGKIRKIMLYPSQNYYLLKGVVRFGDDVKVHGWVDTTEFTKRYGNCPYVFYPNPDAVHLDRLPKWELPGFVLYS